MWQRAETARKRWREENARTKSARHRLSLLEVSTTYTRSHILIIRCGLTSACYRVHTVPASESKPDHRCLGKFDHQHHFVIIRVKWIEPCFAAGIQQTVVVTRNAWLLPPPLGCRRAVRNRIELTLVRRTKFVTFEKPASSPIWNVSCVTRVQCLNDFMSAPKRRRTVVPKIHFYMDTIVFFLYW